MVILQLVHVPLDVIQDAGQAPATVIHCRQHRIRHLPGVSGRRMTEKHGEGTSGKNKICCVTFCGESGCRHVCTCKGVCRGVAGAGEGVNCMHLSASSRYTSERDRTLSACLL